MSAVPALSFAGPPFIAEAVSAQTMFPVEVCPCVHLLHPMVRSIVLAKCSGRESNPSEQNHFFSNASTAEFLRIRFMDSCRSVR